MYRYMYVQCINIRHREMLTLATDGDMESIQASMYLSDYTREP